MPLPRKPLPLTGDGLQGEIVPQTGNPADIASKATASFRPKLYVIAGRINPEALLNGSPNQYRHLDERIQATTEWVQSRLKEAGHAGAISSARSNPKERAAVEQLIDSEALKYISKEDVVRGDDRRILIASVINEIVGLGPIEPLREHPGITEIMVNGPEDVFVEIDGRLQQATGVRFRDQEHLLQLCHSILQAINRSVNFGTPLADGRLGDGSRVNVVHPAVAPQGPGLVIRRFPDSVWTMDKLIENGSVDEEIACEIAFLIKHKASMLICGGTGSGKALDVDTAIPTPSGFVQMGDLHVGDHVFDEHGQPCAVTAVFDQPGGRECFQVSFSDGTTVIADADHNWLTETRPVQRAGQRKTHPRRAIRQYAGYRSQSRLLDVERALATVGAGKLTAINEPPRELGWAKSQGGSLSPTTRQVAPRVCDRDGLFDQAAKTAPLGNRTGSVTYGQRDKSTMESVVTTREIAATLRTEGGHLNHSVRVLDTAVRFTTAPELPADPYLLGFWLGAGTVGTTEISTQDTLALKAYQTRNIGSENEFEAALRIAGILDNKHIPAMYLFTSEGQRRDLLAGLMDSAGTHDRRSQVSFNNKNPGLIRQVRSLVASLGYQARTIERSAMHDDSDHEPLWSVVFNAYDDVFRNSRKNTKHGVARGVRAIRDTRRYITAITPVPSRPVRCITVSSPSHLFLCTDQYVPTHNTSLLNAISSCIPRDERVVTIEDSLELRFHPQAHVFAMESRIAAASGSGEISIRALVRNALRMRPDRIVVGECRDAVALDMLQAMNTGHDGSMTTLHANDPHAAIERLAVLVLMGGEIPAAQVHWLISAALDIIVFQRRFEDGSRRVESVYEVLPVSADGGVGARTQLSCLWEWEQTGTDNLTGKFVGAYVRRNEISERLKHARRLSHFQPVTMDEIKRMSVIPMEDS